MNPRFSLVIPLHNEAGNILPLLERAAPVLAALARDYEILLVDDGSTDSTAHEIAEAHTRWPNVRVITHAKNLGQDVALLTGLRAAAGEIILTMDGDGQNDPADFPALVAPLLAGTHDVMCGWRFDRHDSWLRRRMSRLANFVRSRVLRDGLHDGGCQLRAMRREVVAALFPCELLQAFIPAVARAVGFRVGELKVRHHARTRGTAHYGLRQLWWRPALAMWKLRRQLPRR